MKVMSHGDFKSMEKLHLGIKSSKDLVSTKIEDMSELSIVHVFILMDLEFCSCLLGFIQK
jgi:hypothetical protein